MTTASTFAIVPVKALADAKRRLAPALASSERRRLVLTMLQDVLALLAETPGIARVVVVTPDPEVAAAAISRGAGVVSEAGPSDLNSAVRRGLACARNEGAGRALVIPADVPLATHAEVLSILTSASAGPEPQAVLVPSEDGDGTNAMLLAPPEAMRPEFGEDSFVRHVAQAVALGLDFRVLRLPGLGADIDQPRDLARLAGAERYAFLNSAPNTARSPGRSQRKPNPGCPPAHTCDTGTKNRTIEKVEPGPRRGKP